MSKLLKAPLTWLLIESVALGVLGRINEIPFTLLNVSLVVLIQVSVAIGIVLSREEVKADIFNKLSSY